MQRDIPVMLEGYKCTVVEPPAPKTREDGRGGEVPVTDRDGVMQFVVSVFAKERAAVPGQRVAKGEEIRVTLETDPGPGFDEGTPVAFVNPRVSYFEITGNGRTNSGLSWKARGMAPAGAPGRPAPAPQREGGEK